MTEGELKVPFTPVGSPETPKVTALLKSLSGATVIEYETLPPASTVETMATHSANNPAPPEC